MGQSHQRPPRPADARADRRRDHAGLPDRIHADGHGRVLRLAVLLQREPGHRRAAGARPDGAARLLGDVERRADRDPAVRVHGLSRRARRADRAPVQEPAPRALARPRLARRGHDRHLRDLRHRHRHRRRRGDADGAARVPGNAARRLRHQALRRRDHGRWLPRHPDPAVGAADRLWRDRRRLRRAALCRRVLPGGHARRAVRRLRDHRGEAEACAGAQAQRRGGAGSGAAEPRATRGDEPQCIHGAARRGGRTQPRRAGADGARAILRVADPGTLDHRPGLGHLARRDPAGRGRRHHGAAGFRLRGGHGAERGPGSPSRRGRAPGSPSRLRPTTRRRPPARALPSRRPTRAVSRRRLSPRRRRRTRQHRKPPSRRQQRPRPRDCRPRPGSGSSPPSRQRLGRSFTCSGRGSASRSSRCCSRRSSRCRS